MYDPFEKGCLEDEDLAAWKEIEKKFRRTWRQLAKKGEVDGIDGTGYQHSIHAWIDAKMPKNVKKFLSNSHANN